MRTEKHIKHAMYYHAYSSQATLSLSQPEEIKYALLLYYI